MRCNVVTKTLEALNPILMFGHCLPLPAEGDQVCAGKHDGPIIRWLGFSEHILHEEGCDCPIHRVHPFLGAVSCRTNLLLEQRIQPAGIKRNALFDGVACELSQRWEHFTAAGPRQGPLGVPYPFDPASLIPQGIVRASSADSTVKSLAMPSLRISRMVRSALRRCTSEKSIM